MNVLGLCIGALAYGLFGCACTDPSNDTAECELLQSLRTSSARKDIASFMSVVDTGYKDELGGLNRLREDVRQLFTVYGAIDLELEPQEVMASGLSVRFSGRGRAFSFAGRMGLSLAAGKVTGGLFTELRAVLRLLRARRECVEENSIGLIEPLISMEYHGDRQRLVQRLKDTFLQKRHAAFIVEKLELSIEGKQAHVVQHYVMVVLEAKKKVERHGIDRFTLRKEGARWRIIVGSVAA